MKTLSKTTLTTSAVVGALALTMAAATPASAQSRYGYDDRDRDDDRTENLVLGAVVGALAGALIGNGDGTYVAGGAIAGAALGAGSGGGDDCGYYRGGRCYRNQGHWEREHGINSRDYNSRYSYSYDRRDRRDDRRDRDYRYDRRW
jgi:hypothetical protein